MPKQSPWFVAERAEWFASLILTKHKDMIVRPYVGTDLAIDLLVEVLEDGKPTPRFGVQIVGSIDLPAPQNAEHRVLSHLGRNPLEAGLPLCVFVIGVRKPEGIYRWTVEPVVADGRALLRPNTAPTWQPLDEVGVASLIAQVDAWYEARNGSSKPIGSDRHSNAEAGL